MVMDEYLECNLINHNHNGICSSASTLLCGEHISADEFSEVIKHLHINKPTRKLHKKFFNHPTFTDEAWWWDRFDKESKNERKLFITKMISITRPNKDEKRS